MGAVEMFAPSEGHRRLQRAVIELIATKGLNNFTLVDIGTAADVSRALHRYYYADKSALEGHAVMDLLRPLSSDRQRGLSSLFAAVEATFAALIADPLRRRAIFAVIGHAEADFRYRGMVEAFIQERVVRIEEHLLAAVIAKEIAPLENPGATASLILAMLRGSICHLLTDPTEVNVRQAQKALVNTLRLMLPATPTKEKAMQPQAPTSEAA